LRSSPYHYHRGWSGLCCCSRKKRLLPGYTAKPGVSLNGLRGQKIALNNGEHGIALVMALSSHCILPKEHSLLQKAEFMAIA
jgi:hypothetical protein